MNQPDEEKRAHRAAQDDRKARLAEQLRANLLRRKAQARSRRAGAADSRPEGLLEGEDGAGGGEG